MLFNIASFIEIIIKLFSLTEKFMLSKLPEYERVEKVEKQTIKVVVTHIASHPLVLDEEEVELLLVEEEPLELVLVVEEEVLKDVVLVLGKKLEEAEE